MLGKSIFIFGMALVFLGVGFESISASFVVCAIGIANMWISVGVMINLFQDSCNGNNIYRESFVVTSNNYGLINLNIGEGSQISPNSLGSINWSAGPYFIETAIDLTGTGSNHQVMTCNQLLSVPYALYAETSGSSTPGPQGIQGDPGPPGMNGVGVDSTVDNGNGTITFYYSDFTSFTTSLITGTSLMVSFGRDFFFLLCFFFLGALLRPCNCASISGSLTSCFAITYATYHLPPRSS